MTLAKAIETAGMEKELRKFATPATLNMDLMKWLRGHPKLAALEIEWPATHQSLRYLRKQYKCPAGRGGIRPAGKTLYNVAHRKNRACAPFHP